MKKRSLPAWTVWLLFHGLILSAFLISLLFSSKITFATSLFEILPPSSALHDVQAADSALAARTSRAVTILVKSETFENAKSAAEKLYLNYVDDSWADRPLPNPDYFDSLSLYVDASSVAEVTEWLYDYRFELLDENTMELLNSDAGETIADDALSSVYGAFSISDLSSLEGDPFLLTERNLKRYVNDGAASSTAMSPNDGVLATQKDGAWYVLIRGIVSEKGAPLASKKCTVQNLYDTCANLRKSDYASDESLDFIFSGVPFHSYESSTSAQTQISVISTVALILIVVVFLLIFRSIVPALVSALAVAFSCGIGFVSVLLFFRGIHVLTFVFGTTLIGTCLDYSIHYFVTWKAHPDCNSGIAVRNHIFRGITLGFVSTEICFAALFFAPFPLLKQVSVFLFTGLAAAFLSVVALYPFLKMPAKKSQLHLFFQQSDTAKNGTGFSKKLIIPVVLFVFSVSVIVLKHESFGIRNNIQELYSMSPKMLSNEITSAKVLNTGSSGWYFIVKGETEEELLQTCELLDAELMQAKADGRAGSFLSVTQFIPSKLTQEKSYRAAENLIALAAHQYEALGFDRELASAYEESYKTALGKHISLSTTGAGAENLPEMIKQAIESLWIGEIDGEFYACVMPLHTKSDDELFFREYADRTDGVYFVNKVKDISRQLDILSKTMLLMLAVAFVVVIAILFFCYDVRTVLKIAAVPLLVTLVTCAVLLLCNIPLSFFPITALVLVFGLGLDYIIYAVERKDGNFAILLSFVTTVLSFGALAISTFPPVHMLGVTVFVGLTSAVVSAFSLSR